MKTLGKIHKFLSEENSNLLDNKNGKALLKEYVNYIKKNKELFDYHCILEGIEKEINEDIKDKYVNYLMTLIENYKHKNVNKHISKLSKIVEGYLSEDQLKRYELLNERKDELDEELHNCLINKKNTTKNFIKLNSLSNKINENIRILKPNIPNIDVSEYVSEFNKKNANSLNENEKTFIKEVINCKNTNEQELLVKKLQSECIVGINTLLSETQELELKEKLLNFKEKILLEEKDNFREKAISLFRFKEELSKD